MTMSRWIKEGQRTRGRRGDEVDGKIRQKGV
jgi:hypothetical protein